MFERFIGGCGVRFGLRGEELYGVCGEGLYEVGEGLYELGEEDEYVDWPSTDEA